MTLDLDHLTLQTLGNREVQREVLALFFRQSGEQIERLKTTTDGSERRDAAHAIVGSARAIGAFDVARIAGEIERNEGAGEVEIGALAKAIAETRDFIICLLVK